MKKMFALLAVVSVLLCGCSDSSSKEAEQIIIYGDSAWVFDNTTITIPRDYKFNDFSKVYGEDTITVTLNYKKSTNK